MKTIWNRFSGISLITFFAILFSLTPLTQTYAAIDNISWNLDPGEYAQGKKLYITSNHTVGFRVEVRRSSKHTVNAKIYDPSGALIDHVYLAPGKKYDDTIYFPDTGYYKMVLQCAEGKAKDCDAWGNIAENE